MRAVSTYSHEQPLASPEAVAARPSARRAALSGELLIIGLLVFCYDRVRNVAPTRRSMSLQDGLQLLGLERHLRINVELATNVWLAAHHTLADIASWYYQLAHLSVTMVVLVVCYVQRPDIYRPARNALVLINVIGLFIFWVYPVAPPRLLPGMGYLDITEITGVASASNTSAPDPYAAMPSLHTAWAIWVTMIGLLLVRSWVLRTLCVVYPVLTVIVIVSTANHYLLDAVAGAAVALVAAALAGLFPPRIDAGLRTGVRSLRRVLRRRVGQQSGN
jgi:membrane-associated phospholipid phosphatase